MLCLLYDAFHSPGRRRANLANQETFQLARGRYKLHVECYYYRGMQLIGAGVPSSSYRLRALAASGVQEETED